MLKQTSPILLSEPPQVKKTKILTETSMFQKSSNKQENIDTVNTIKIDFTRMAQGKVNCSQFTQCQCGAILTSEDKVGEYERDGEFLIWDCRYCKKVNKSKELYYCDNGSKIVLEKNIQRGFLPPILLFVIDLSGSMGESISVQLDDYSKKQSNLITASKEMLEIIKNCNFQQKQLHKETELKYNYRFDEQKEGFKNSKMKGTNYFSKIALFMGIIENYLEKIKLQSQYSQFRIGFVFFNERVYILKPTKQKMIPTFVAKNSNFAKDFPFQKNIVDFESYEAMFNAGKKFERFFGDSRLKSCDLSKLMVENLDTEGQTALGPALALALGITSVHDIGSRIVLISDSDPNMGILSQQTSMLNENIYAEITKFLQLRKSTLGVLNWITEQSKTYQERMKSDFGRFLSSNREQIVEITLDFSLRQNHIDVLTTARKTLQSLISRGSLGEVISVKTLTSCPRVEANKLKYDDINFRFVKFLGMQRKTWIQLKLKKFLPQDFLFPVFTQIVFTYEDVLTKQKYLFMSYVKHKIISVSHEKEVYQYMEESSRSNIKELMDLQRLFNFDRENIIPESIASRNFQYTSIKMQQPKDKSNETVFQFCESLNSLAQLQTRRNEDEQQYL